MRDITSDLDMLHTEAEAAVILRRSLRSLLNDRKAGRIKFLRLGGATGRGVRYRRSDLDAFMTANENVSASTMEATTT